MRAVRAFGLLGVRKLQNYVSSLFSLSSMHISTLRGRGWAIKLTWVSLSVGKHAATAPAIVRARS